MRRIVLTLALLTLAFAPAGDRPFEAAARPRRGGGYNRVGPLPPRRGPQGLRP